MPIHQTDFQFYAEDAQPNGRYYWTLVWYHTDSFVDPTAGPFYNALVNFHNTLQPVGVTRNGIRSQRLAPTYHDYGIFTVPYVGTRTVDSPLTLINIPRLNYFADGARLGYKRLRVPMQLSEFGNGVLTDAYRSMLQDECDTLLAATGLSNAFGVLADTLTVSPLVYGWQLRHGTERRSRVVL